MDQEIQIVRECILPHYAAQQKEDIIQELSKRMKERNLVNADFQEAVLKREQKYPTGLLIGKRNIAIPHTEPQYVKVPCIGIATLKKSVAFHRMDACDELVDVDVVLLLALNQAHAHMEMLSRIILIGTSCMRRRNPDFRYCQPGSGTGLEEKRNHRCGNQGRQTGRYRTVR